MNIHPTALVADGATLAEDVVIGPGAIIGAKSQIGAGCVIGAHVIIENRVVVGDGTQIGHGSILGANPQSLGFDAGREDTGVVIGKNNIIREYVTIHRATKENGDTVIGEDNFLMTGCHVGHDTVVCNGVILTNNVLLAGHVHVEDRAVCGGSSLFHQFVRVGACAMIGGGGRMSKDIPPFLVAAGMNSISGINSIGIRRAGFNREARSEIRRAFGLLYLSGHNVSQALEAASQESWGPEAASFWEFVRGAKKRGICDYSCKDLAVQE